MACEHSPYASDSVKATKLTVTKKRQKVEAIHAILANIRRESLHQKFRKLETDFNGVILSFDFGQW